MPPLTGDPLLAHLLQLALPPGHLGPCPLCPLLPEAPSPGPHSQEGASAVRTHHGRLSNAPRHLRLSEALCNGRVASRRRPTSVAASGSSLLVALARRAQTAGVRPGGASTARPSRSAGRCPRGRRPGLPTSCSRSSPSLSPAGDPGL